MDLKLPFGYEMMWQWRKRNCTDARNADLIRAECGSECESIKSLSGEPWDTADGRAHMLWVSLARYTDEYFWGLAYLCCYAALGHLNLQADSQVEALWKMYKP